MIGTNFASPEPFSDQHAKAPHMQVMPSRANPDRDFVRIFSGPGGKGHEPRQTDLNILEQDLTSLSAEPMRSSFGPNSFSASSMARRKSGSTSIGWREYFGSATDSRKAPRLLRTKCTGAR